MNTIIDVLKNEKLIDIFQIGVGLVGNKEIELIPNYTVIFLQFETTYIKLNSIEQEKKLHISKVENIDFGTIPIEEDLPPYKNSIAKFLLTDDEFINRIESINVYYSEKYAQNELICEALLLVFNNQTIFFDPSYYWGINMGGILQLEEWLKNHNTENEIIKTMENFI